MAVRSPGTGDLEGPVAEQEELVRRRLETAEEAVGKWGSRGGSDAGGGGVSDSPELAAAVRELISLSSGGGSSGQRAKMALQVINPCRLCMLCIPSFFLACRRSYSRQ
uniref:Uncharacterized protein n=1 Tax=Setaria italica TaxID=4555 RepID=K3Y076_SETIT